MIGVISALEISVAGRYLLQHSPRPHDGLHLAFADDYLCRCGLSVRSKGTVKGDNSGRRRYGLEEEVHVEDTG